MTQNFQGISRTSLNRSIDVNTGLHVLPKAFLYLGVSFPSLLYEKSKLNVALTQNLIQLSYIKGLDFIK